MEADIAAKAVELGTNTDFSLLSLFLRADIIVKSVMIILILCSVGLLAAIPAVVAYNKFNNDSKKYSEKLENFSKRFLTII